MKYQKTEFFFLNCSELYSLQESVIKTFGFKDKKVRRSHYKNFEFLYETDKLF